MNTFYVLPSFLLLATNPAFFSYSHLTDYLRYLFLFKFGGTCAYFLPTSVHRH